MKAVNNKKEVTAKTVTVKKVSNYKTNVIEANKALNVEKNSLGAYIDLLIKYDSVLCIEFRSYLKDIKEGNKANYENLKKVVRTTKNGKFNQFYTLQGLQKICFPKK
jgi:hypothetical protein